VLRPPVAPAPPAPGPALAYGPSVVIAPLAILALAAPWGPVPLPLALALAALGASGSTLATTHLAEVWRRRRLRELFPDWLAFLSAAVDLGVPLAAALEVAAAGVDPPLREPAAALALAALRGEAGPALGAFAEAVGTAEATFVVSVLERQRHLGVSVASLLLEEEGMLARLRWQERQARQGVVPYAFTASVGVLLVNAAVLFLAPRAAELLGMLRSTAVP